MMKDKQRPKFTVYYYDDFDRLIYELNEFEDFEEAKKYLLTLYENIEEDAREWEGLYIKDSNGKIVFDTLRLMSKESNTVSQVLEEVNENEQ